MIYHRISNIRNTADSTSKVGTTYHSGTHEFILVVGGVPVRSSLVFCVVFGKLFLLDIVLLIFPLFTDGYIATIRNLGSAHLRLAIYMLSL